MKPADWTAADDDAAWAEMRDCLCPECDGEGRVVGGMCYQGNPWQPPEYEELVCPVCDGQGILTAPSDEAA